MIVYMKWAVVVSVLVSIIFVILGLSHIVDFGRFAYLVLHPGLTTSTDILKIIMSGVPALFLVAGIFDIIVEVIIRRKFLFNSRA